MLNNWSASQTGRTRLSSWQLRAQAELELRRRRQGTAGSGPVYAFRGNNEKLQTAQDAEIVLSGAAGTGKSLACLYKLHTCANQYPHFRGLIIRKTRESLNESGLVTFERDVLGEDSTQLSSASRNSRHAYKYPHGAEIIVAGLLQSNKDQKAKILSTEYDLIYVQEATELLEDEWQKLTTRLRNGRMPYQQIIGDCNPDAPLHWIWRRGQTDRLKLWETTHKDNPSLWNGNAWTANGAAYIARLESLTGITRSRLLEGLWVQATGLVYGDVWADGPTDGNVTEAADYAPGAGAVLWGVDDGYAGELDTATGTFTANSHPRAFLLCQLRADGVLCVFNESYAVKRLSDEHIQAVQAMCPSPDFAAVDKSAAELIGRLNRANIHTRRSPASVDESIKLLREWLGQDVNKVRRVLVHPRCRHLRLEMASYKYEADSEKPEKVFDHGCDALRYLVWTLRHNS